MTQLQEAVRLLKRWAGYKPGDSPSKRAAGDALQQDTDNFLEAYRVNLDG